ncbi:2'-5' RNA ligase family protein [Sneathiella marina]|uniref:2'-5' RNA ligase family protein n=1 Tax=Sneathiella marina TaxID=2950108 RepID=A0ABY4W7M8_9PROT|nr:2'-5' RNA ligase family protein [Sneathiella marina]USG63185.1 2'-5' RNA ligase family protein [Sneathiella marina]
MIYVLAYPEFDPDIFEAIEKFRSINEPERARLVAPHITLVFALRDEKPEDFADFCSRKIRSMKRFPITFDRFEILHDPVETTHKICLVCGEGGQKIKTLHHALYEGPHRSGLRADIPFKPHMTIATNANVAPLEKLDPTVIGAFPVRAEINTINIIEVTEGRLRNVRTVSLRD